MTGLYQKLMAVCRDYTCLSDKDIADILRMVADDLTNAEEVAREYEDA